MHLLCGGELQSVRRALFGGLHRRLVEDDDVAEVGRGGPALALDGDVVGDGAVLDLALHLPVGVGGVPALDAEPRVRHLVRVVGRVDAVLVTVLRVAVLDVAHRDGLGVEALLGAGLPVDPPGEAQDARDDERDRASDLQSLIAAAVAVTHGCTLRRAAIMPRYFVSACVYYHFNTKKSIAQTNNYAHRRSTLSLLFLFQVVE